MKKFRLCLILLCAVMFLTACGTKPQKESGTSEETTPLGTSAQQTDDPTETGEPAATQKLILSLPATKQTEIENQTRKIEVLSDGEKDGVPMNALRILSPEGEELWKISYAADGNTQCGIVVMPWQEGGDQFEKGFIYWYVKTVPNESITAFYMTYAALENGKYEKLSTIFSAQGMGGVGGLGGGKRIDISTASAYLAGKLEFIDFLYGLASKLYDGAVLFDSNGVQMQWEQWFTHEIAFTDPTTGEPTTLEIIGRDR